jgi:hypothetical protein
MVGPGSTPQADDERLNLGGKFFQREKQGRVRRRRKMVSG